MPREIEDGGFAFPGEHSADPETVKTIRDETGLGMQDVKRLLSKHGGMSLRDYFAGHALSAVVVATSAGQHHPGALRGLPDGTSIDLRMACDAYALADAMIAARSK